MKPSYLKPFFVAAASFTIGLLIPSPLDGEAGEQKPDQSPSGNLSSNPLRISDAHEKNTARSTSSSRSELLDAVEPQAVDLNSAIVDFLINFHARSFSPEKIERTLAEMGLDKDQIKKVVEIKDTSLAGLQELEIKHAKLQSDDQGDYYLFEAFPEDRKIWMAGIVQQLQDFVGVDRAILISRIFSEVDGGEEFGQSRREIRAGIATKPDAGVPVSVKIFDQNGNPMSEGSYSYEGGNQSRWEHLFKSESE